MIRKLRRRLVGAAMLALALVLTAVLGGINWMSYRKVVRDADDILTVLSENDGKFPQRGENEVPPPAGKGDPGHGMSPETPFESRYFTVLLDADGAVLRTDTGRIAAVDAETAQADALAVWQSGGSGFRGDYRYAVSAQDGNTLVIFLDCGRSLSAFRSTLLASAAVSVAGLAAVFLLLLLFSGRIVRPMAESYEKQRQFVTDAGHEIRTPLTIIRADAELAGMDCGPNEWLQDIARQTDRLTGLTNDLIFLSRMDEDAPAQQRIEFPISDVAEEMAQSFLAPARMQGKTLEISVEPMLSYCGDEKAIRQMLSILLDNAVKYSPEGAQLSLRLERQGRGIRLTVQNPSAQPLDPARLDRMFDRFYRGDPARSETSGYGLGLAIVQSVAAVHRGKVRARCPEQNVLQITVSLPG